MIWFTSDTHFNHPNVLGYSQRPFTDIEEMTEKFIENWNARVAAGDIIYHLGDFALTWGKKHTQIVDDILARLNGQKWLIKGNHDRDEVTKNSRWVDVVPMKEIKFENQLITLCHYAMRTWNQSHRLAWMLHGHSHGTLPDSGGLTLDVGVDCFNYSPVSFDELQPIMESRDPVFQDHHRS